MSKQLVLLVEDDNLLSWSMEQSLSDDGYQVVCARSGEEALKRIRAEQPDLILLDIMLPGISGIEVLKKMGDLAKEVVVIILTASDVVQTAVEAMKLGAYDYISKPFDMAGVKITMENALERTRLQREVTRLRKEQQDRFGFDGIIGSSPAMQEVYARIAKIVQMDVKTVLILGETGTGKDLVSKTIHHQSQRQTRPFIEINCTSIPDKLLESELFGYEKGAFTDAKSLKRGLIEQAHGGTILLDEIGHMPRDLQAKLLRVIEERKYRRVGGIRDYEVDVMLIAATNRNLLEAVAEGDFRDDLYYRINLIPINMPALRERKEDIPQLCEHFVRCANREFRRDVKGISAEAERMMYRYDWPGNVRELKNVIDRAIILGEGEQILAKHLPREIANEVPVVTTDFRLPPHGVSLPEVENNLIHQALRMADRNQVQAAQLLGISRHTLRHRMKKHGFL